MKADAVAHKAAVKASVFIMVAIRVVIQGWVFCAVEETVCQR